MAKQYLRHAGKGSIYNYSELAANNADLEVVSEEEAFPERGGPPKPSLTKPRKTKAKVSLDTDEKQLENAVNPDKTSPGVAEQATRGLKRKGFK